MASGCVCVVTETPGIEEVLKNGSSGFVVSPRDVDAAVARIDDLFSGRVDAMALITAASRHIAGFFDVSRSMQSYRDQWQDAITLRQIRVGEGVMPVRQTLGASG
jgi:glycosyltransferase involved in cell wall biosynthesis